MGYMKCCLKKNRGERRGGYLGAESRYLSLALLPLFLFSVGSGITGVCPGHCAVKEPQSLAWGFLCFADDKKQNFAETRQPALAEGISQGLIKTKGKSSSMLPSINNANKLVTFWSPNFQSHSYKLHH